MCCNEKTRKKVTAEGDSIALATGRKPSVNDMGLENIGVELNDDNSGMLANVNLETNAKGVFAIDDCTGDKQFACCAGCQSATAARNMSLCDLKILECHPAPCHLQRLLVQS